MDKQHSVMILSDNEEMYNVIKSQLEERGMLVSHLRLWDIKHGNQDLFNVIDHYDPSTIIYDLAPPYQGAYSFFELIRGNEALKDRDFVVTTPNLHALQSIGVSGPVWELTGEIDEVLDMIEESFEDSRTEARQPIRDRMGRHQTQTDVENPPSLGSGHRGAVTDIEHDKRLRRNQSEELRRSRQESGRKGGQRVSRERGPEFFQEIGRKGGQSRGEDIQEGQVQGRDRTG